MSFPLTYRDAMNQLAELAQPGQPVSIQRQALATIARELSPSRPKHRDVLLALNPPSPDPTFPEAPLTPEQRKALHLHPVEADLATPADAETLPTDDGDSTDEEDDPF